MAKKSTNNKAVPKKISVKKSLKKSLPKKPSDKNKNLVDTSKVKGSSKSAQAAKVKKLPAGAEVVEGEFLGKVEDFFVHVGVIALTLKDVLALGDTIRIKGHTTDLVVKVESLQIEHQAVSLARKGQGVGIKIPDRARIGDRVYRI